jgi:hypothetical protein
MFTMVTTAFACIRAFLTGILPKNLSFLNIALCILFMFGAIQTVRIEGIHVNINLRIVTLPLFNLDGFEDEREKNLKEIKSLTDRISERVRVSVENRRKQEEENARFHKESAPVAKGLDNDLNISSKRALDALRIRIGPGSGSNRVLQPAATQGGSQHPAGVCGTDCDTKSGSSPDVAPEVVSIPRDEYEHLVENTTVLLYLRKFFEEGVARGWFVVSDGAPEALKTDK